MKPLKFEHIFVAAITFSPFLLCKYFSYQLVAYWVCFKGGGGGGGGGVSHLPPKFEHIFVAVITFPPFLLCRYFLLPACCLLCVL